MYLPTCVIVVKVKVNLETQFQPTVKFNSSFSF